MGQYGHLYSCVCLVIRDAEIFRGLTVCQRTSRFWGITYKARPVAKVYSKKSGFDYEETFSLVAMIKPIRILLSIAAFYDYEI